MSLKIIVYNLLKSCLSDRKLLFPGKKKKENRKITLLYYQNT